MTLYKGKYRIESARLKLWDYSTGGAYFITICTKNMTNYFGNVEKEEMVLTSLGLIAKEEWIKTEQIRINVELDEYMIMPNHIHGIIFLLDDNSTETSRRDVSNSETTHRVVSTTLKKNSIGSIIGQYKSRCTKRIKELGLNDFGWQQRFYDHIIRNEKEMYNIRKYIFYNPLKWSFDEYYNNNL